MKFSKVLIKHLLKLLKGIVFFIAILILIGLIIYFTSPVKVLIVGNGLKIEDVDLKVTIDNQVVFEDTLNLNGIERKADGSFFLDFGSRETNLKRGAYNIKVRSDKLDFQTSGYGLFFLSNVLMIEFIRNENNELDLDFKNVMKIGNDVHWIDSQPLFPGCGNAFYEEEELEE